MSYSYFCKSPIWWPSFGPMCTQHIPMIMYTNCQVLCLLWFGSGQMHPYSSCKLKYTIVSGQLNNPENVTCKHQELLWNGKKTEHNKWLFMFLRILQVYIDVIMTRMVSQITGLTIVYLTVYSDVDQRKHQSSASLAFMWGIHRDRWIPRTKGQLRGKCYHLMTSSWTWKYQG